MSNKETRWVARLTPAPNFDVDALLDMPLGLDVWERHAESVIVVASDRQLSELERRRLVQVERLHTITKFQSHNNCNRRKL